MKAIRVPAPPRFELVELPYPSCGPEEVIVRTAYCGVCGTDVEILHGALPPGHVRYPVVPGHEWVGVVEETGSAVTGIRAGDRVSVEGYLPCGVCSACRAGEANRCVRQEQIGMTHNGGLAEYVAAPYRSCHRVPDSVSLEEALMVEPASTVVRGIDRARLSDGVRAAIIGCGTIGLIAARVIGLHRPAQILGIDLSEAQATLARQAGMTEFTAHPDTARLRASGGEGGWDLVVVCAQGSRPLKLAFEIVRKGGCVVVIGGAPDTDQITIPANLLVLRDLQVEGVFGYTTASWKRTLDLIGSGQLKLGDLITHRAPIHEFARALHLVEARPEPIGKVVISFEDGQSS